MIKKIVSYIIFVIIPLMSFSGWKHVNNDITSFYFYKGVPHYLILKNDLLFVKLKSQQSNQQLEELLIHYDEVSSFENYSQADKKLFVKLNRSLDQIEFEEIANQLMSNDNIVHVSPVFSPDNGKTLIGVEDEIIVQFKEGITEYEINSCIQSKGYDISLDIDLKGGRCYLLKITGNDFAIDAANELFQSGLVKWAEPNLYYTNVLCYLPNDPFVNDQWSIQNTGSNIPGSITGTPDCDMDIDSAWMQGRGSSKVIISVSDTGIDTLHEDLIQNLIPGSGYNFIHNIPGAFDDGNHGTAVTGIIAAVSDNGIGVSGIAPRTKLIPVKWLNSTGSGNFTGAVNATIYSYQNGAWIINNSWGFTGGASSALDQAITDAVTFGRNGKGTLFIVGAGNENSVLRYPANSHPDVISVGSISPCNERKKPSSCDGELWGSNYGNNLHVVVPGVKIFTTDRSGAAGYSNEDYFPYFTGTSSATPHVAGVCALILSVDSTLRWDTVRARITRFSEKRGAYNYSLPGPLSTGQWYHEMGYGLVNANKSIQFTIDQLGPHIEVDLHQNTEDLNGPFLINALINPNSYPVISSSIKLFWVKDKQSNWNSVNMVSKGDNRYTAEIPGDGNEGFYKYYITATDDLNRVITHPFTAPLDFHAFNVGYDTIPPQIEHTPIGLIGNNYWPSKVEANVTDYFGIDSVYVLWKVNSFGMLNRFELNLNEFGTYEGYFNSLPGVISSDTIYYKVSAKDNSINGNINSTEQFAITFYERTVAFFEDFPYSYVDTNKWISNFGIVIADSNMVVHPPFENPFPSRPFVLRFKTDPGFIESKLIDLSSFDIAYLSLFKCEKYMDANDSLLIEYKNANNQWKNLHVFIGTNDYGESFDSLCYTIPKDGLHSNFKLRLSCHGFVPVSNEFLIDNIMVFGGTFTRIEQISSEIPLNFFLHQNYPNPFNPVTKIKFEIPKQSHVKLKIFDILGREVANLVNSEYDPGSYSIDFNASEFTSGVYFYRIDAGEFVQTKRMVLIK